MKSGIKKYDSVRRKLIYLAVIPTLITSLLLGVYFTSTRVDDVHVNLARKGQLIASILSPSVEFGLFSHDVVFLKSLLAPLLSGNDVVSILILDKSRDVIVASISSEYSASQLLSDENKTSVFESAVYSTRFNSSELLELDKLPKKSTLTPKPELMGWVVVKLSTYSSQKRQNEIILNALVFIFLGVFFSALIAYRMSKKIALPIHSLTNTIREISTGKLHSRSSEKATGELLLLQQGINAMAETIQGSQKRLERRVTKATGELTETVAELEKKNAVLNATQADLISANAAKNDFLAKMSHEIRTPLMTVIGFSRLIEKAKSKDDVTSYTRLINRSGEQLLNIVDDILSFSKLEDEHVTVSCDVFDVRDLIDDVVSMLASAAKEKHINLFVDVSAEVPEYLKSDSGKLSQIMINLVNNAVKFTESGHVLINVFLSLSIDEEVDVTFEVIDTGIGISPADREKIFGSFLQADSDRNRAYEGTGLGLAISKKLVELMGGEIGVDTSMESGSRFWFTVPMRLNDEVDNLYNPKVLGQTIVLYDSGDLSSRSLSKLFLSWKADLYICETDNKMLDLISNQSLQIDVVVVSLDFNESTEENVLRLVEAIRKRFSGCIVLLISHMFAELRQVLSDASHIVVLERPVHRQRLYDVFQFGEKSGVVLGGDTQVPALFESNTVNQSPHVLVAEDNEFNSILIGELLLERGIGSKRVGNSNAVLQALEQVDGQGGEKKVEQASEEQKNRQKSQQKDQKKDQQQKGKQKDKQKKYDLLLLDIHMPGMDGLTLAKQIRKNKLVSEDTPIIAFTADVYVRNGTQLQESGINDVLYKPLTDESLDQVLSDWLPSFTLSKKKTEAVDSVVTKGMTQRLVDDVLLHLNKIEVAYKTKDDAEMAEHFHQLSGMLGYFQYEGVLDSLKELRVFALSRNDHKFCDTLLSLTKRVKLGALD